MRQLIGRRLQTPQQIGHFALTGHRLRADDGHRIQALQGGAGFFGRQVLRDRVIQPGPGCGPRCAQLRLRLGQLGAVGHKAVALIATHVDGPHRTQRAVHRLDARFKHRSAWPGQVLLAKQHRGPGQPRSDGESIAVHLAQGQTGGQHAQAQQGVVQVGGAAHLLTALGFQRAAQGFGTCLGQRHRVGAAGGHPIAAVPGDQGIAGGAAGEHGRAGQGEGESLGHGRSPHHCRPATDQRDSPIGPVGKPMLRRATQPVIVELRDLSRSQLKRQQQLRGARPQLSPIQIASVRSRSQASASPLTLGDRRSRTVA